MSLSELREIKDEIHHHMQEAQKASTLVKEVLAEYRERLKSSFPHESLVGRPYVFAKSKWIYGEAKCGIIDNSSFCDVDGQFLMKHHDILSGSEVSQILKDDLKMKECKSYHIKPSSNYLLAVTYDWESTFAMDAEARDNNIVVSEDLYEYLFIELVKN